MSTSIKRTPESNPKPSRAETRATKTRTKGVVVAGIKAFINPRATWLCSDTDFLKTQHTGTGNRKRGRLGE
jgi:hypothetical protein